MVIIDKQGRIFGKWNIIDFLVCCFFLCLLPLFWFQWKIFNIKSQQSKSKITIEIPIKEYEELKALQQKINNFLNEHKRARKYFE